MNCKDFIGLLADFLEMTLPPAVFADLEAHLAGCAPCQAYLRTYRRTQEVATAAERASLPAAMPAEMKSRLRAFLLAQLLKDES